MRSQKPRTQRAKLVSPTTSSQWRSIPVRNDPHGPVAHGANLISPHSRATPAAALVRAVRALRNADLAIDVEARSLSRLLYLTSLHSYPTPNTAPHWVTIPSDATYLPQHPRWPVPPSRAPLPPSPGLPLPLIRLRLRPASITRLHPSHPLRRRYSSQASRRYPSDRDLTHQPLSGGEGAHCADREGRSGGRTGCELDI